MPIFQIQKGIRKWEKVRKVYGDVKVESRLGFDGFKVIYRLFRVEDL